MHKYFTKMSMNNGKFMYSGRKVVQSRGRVRDAILTLHKYSLKLPKVMTLTC